MVGGSSAHPGAVLCTSGGELVCAHKWWAAPLHTRGLYIVAATLRAATALVIVGAHSSRAAPLLSGQRLALLRGSTALRRGSVALSRRRVEIGQQGRLPLPPHDRIQAAPAPRRLQPAHRAVRAARPAATPVRCAIAVGLRAPHAAVPAHPAHPLRFIPHGHPARRLRRLRVAPHAVRPLLALLARTRSALARAQHQAAVAVQAFPVRTHGPILAAPHVPSIVRRVALPPAHASLLAAATRALAAGSDGGRYPATSPLVVPAAAFPALALALRPSAPLALAVDSLHRRAQPAAVILLPALFPARALALLPSAPRALAAAAAQ